MTATEYAIPVPGCWASSDLTDQQRAALEAVAELNPDTDPTGNLRDAVDQAKYALNVSKNKPELVLLATRFEESHGADLGYTVSFPGIVADEEKGGGATRRIRIKATVLADLILEQHQIPPAYLSEATLTEPAPAVLIGRITMVDDRAETVTVELFSKTDQYEVTVPNSIVLDETCTSQRRIDRRQTLYRVLSREFGAS